MFSILCFCPVLSFHRDLAQYWNWFCTILRDISLLEIQWYVLQYYFLIFYIHMYFLLQRELVFLPICICLLKGPQISFLHRSAIIFSLSNKGTVAWDLNFSSFFMFSLLFSIKEIQRYKGDVFTVVLVMNTNFWDLNVLSYCSFEPFGNC